MRYWSRFSLLGQSNHRENDVKATRDRTEPDENKTNPRKTRSLVKPSEAETIGKPPHDKYHDAENDLEHRRNRRPLWIACGITAVYAVFAGLQWYTMRESLNETMANERAWLSVEDLKLVNLPDVPDVTFKVENAGNTPASRVSAVSSQAIQRLLADGDEPSFEGTITEPILTETEPTLAQGKTRAYDFQVVRAMPLSAFPPKIQASLRKGPQFTDVLAGKAVLQVQIIVTYYDIFGHPHLTTNCIAYSATHGAPHPCEGGHQEQ